MKLHVHDEQLDGHLHARCGKVPADSPTILMPSRFEAALPEMRCRVCDRWWFPNGQPDWHQKQAQRAVAKVAA